MKSKNYFLKYLSPAADYDWQVNLDEYNSYDAFKDKENPWENLSLPLGNGLLGACIFGGADTERIQITENSFANPIGQRCGAGLNNLAEIYINFGHKEYESYLRTLSLNEAIANTEYKHKGVVYKREYFTSLDNGVMAVALSADKERQLGFKLRLHPPFEKDYCQQQGDGKGKKSFIIKEDNAIILSSTLDYYKVTGALAVTCVSDGAVIYTDNGLEVSDAQNAVIYIAVGSNYQLCERVFLEPSHDKKLENMPMPYDMIKERLEGAVKMGYEANKAQHIKEYKHYFDRVALSFGGKAEDIPTNELLNEYKTGKKSRYLEELIFHYGRYLLISSCKEDTLPPNLQGIWNQYSDSPWTAGYWHNINIQMNYWLAFNCNLSEKFKSYIKLFGAFLPLARKCADNYVKEYFPENYGGEGKNGWNIGTGCWPYHIYGVGIYDHSGPATAAFTAMLFWDYYDYSRDKELLKSVVYPVLYEVSLYLSKIMIFKDGKWLIKYSASPEQWQDGKTYRTIGAAFDQQLCFEIFTHTVYAASLLELDDELIEELKNKIPLLDPYLYGASGQIKEFREEKKYGEIGEKNHRHISHLLGVYPGVCAPFDDTEFQKAVETTLKLRGFSEIGWAEVHRMCVWTRLGNSDMAYSELDHFISCYIHDNLWNGIEAPFQIDANLGVSAGIAEMLLQSHRGYLEFIPNLNENWKDGVFSGLVARGGFEVSLEWHNCRPQKAVIKSLAGGKLAVKLPKDASGSVQNIKNAQYNNANECITIDTVKGESYIFEFGYDREE